MKLRYFPFFHILILPLIFVFIQPTSATPPHKSSQRVLPGPLDFSDQRAIAFLEKEAAREKRTSHGSASGSSDFLKHIKKSITHGIKSKISQFAKSSAGASAYFSKSSSGHQHHHEPVNHGHYYPYPPHLVHHVPHVVDDYHEKPFDLFDMKKSVLYTLLQAVKAIKGGVIAIKGQLLKGGGHLLSAKGKLIRGGGEALSSLGKNIALSAFHFVPESHETHDNEGVVIHEEPGYGYSPPSAHSGPSAPGAYEHPSGGSYYPNSVYDGKAGPAAGQPVGAPHDGLIILRKIPNHDHDHPPHSAYTHQQPQAHAPEEDEQPDAQESQRTPAFRPLSDEIMPQMKNLISSVFYSSGGTKPASKSTASRNTNLRGAQNEVQNALRYVGHTQLTLSHPKQETNDRMKNQKQANVDTLLKYLQAIKDSEVIQNNARPSKIASASTGNDLQNAQGEKNEVVANTEQIFVTPPTQKPPVETRTQFSAHNSHAPIGYQQESQLKQIQQLQQLLRPSTQSTPVILDLPPPQPIPSILTTPLELPTLLGNIAPYEIIPGPPQNMGDNQILHNLPLHRLPQHIKNYVPIVGESMVDLNTLLAQSGQYEVIQSVPKGGYYERDRRSYSGYATFDPYF